MDRLFAEIALLLLLLFFTSFSVITVRRVTFKYFSGLFQSGASEREKSCCCCLFGKSLAYIKVSNPFPKKPGKIFHALCLF